MAEPFSLAVNVIQIISTCTATIKTIDHLIKQYKEAATKLESLASEADLIKARLKQLNEVLQGKTSFYAGKLQRDLDLRAAIDRTLTGCWTVFLLLHKELGKLLPETSKDFNCIQRIRLLFNDEIIQDYRSQIRGHVQGLESVLSCLQAQTVSETHELLRKASETLERIANATLNIRKQHTEYCFPESVYEGYTTFDENKTFDTELVNTPAYRAALFQITRRNTLIDGNAFLAAGSSESARAQKQPSKDFLSDRPIEERNSVPENTELLDAEEIEDLITFNDDAENLKGGNPISPSAVLMDLEGISWGLTVPRLLDEIDIETIANGTRDPNSLTGEEAHLISPEDSRNPQSKPRKEITQSLMVHEPDDLLMRPQSNRALGGAEQNRVSITVSEDTTSESYHHSDEKIPVWTETANPATSSVSRFDSTSTANTGITNYTFTSESVDLSPLSPGDKSPLSDQSSPSTYRWSNPPPDTHSSISKNTLSASHGGRNLPASVPLTDREFEQRLLDRIPHCVDSQDPVVRLNWAEDALRHCAVSSAHEKRLAEMKDKGKAPQVRVLEIQRDLRSQASDIVHDLRQKEHSRAYFLGARYIVPLEEKSQLYLLAYGKEHHRSSFYLGKMAEEKKFVGDAIKRYMDGADRGDAACLYRLARAHLEGELSIKRDKKRGISLLDKAAQVADADCPEPLHHLATLHLEPPISKMKSGFKLSKSKPLIEHSVPDALRHLRKAALMGHGPSQLLLGRYYLYGDFDAREAKRRIRKCSFSNSSVGRRNSSLSASSTGPGDSEINRTLGRHYLHLAARRGLPEADYEIAYDLFWDTNKLTKHQEKQAYAYATRALLGEVSDAYSLLGKAYEEGIGCKRDLETAEKYYYEGRKTGDSWAQGRSDALRKQGVGVAGNELSYIGGQLVTGGRLKNDAAGKS